MGVLRHLRKTLQPANPTIEVLRRKVEENSLFKDRMAWSKKRHKEKMSEILLDFAEPWLEDAPDFEAKRDTISFAIICWNCAVAQERGAEGNLDMILKKVGHGKDFVKGFKSFAEPMLQRKRMLFADNKRFIMDWQYVEEDDCNRLYVVSTLSR